MLITKSVKTVKQFEFNQVSLLISVRNMFLSKTFSMSEMNIYQILRLKYYKKAKRVLDR